jgi:hypothetical protein
MATVEQQRALALAQARMRAQQVQGGKSFVDNFIVDPLASIGAGVAERKAGIQQAFASPEQQRELGKEVAKAQQFQQQRGMTGTIGGIIGRDVLAPVAAGVGFTNPLSAGALLTAGGVGAGLGYTTPSVNEQTAGERRLNAGLGFGFGLGGQTVGGVVSRLLERGAGAAARGVGAAPEVPSPALAAERVGETLRGQYGAARQATKGAYEAVEQAGEMIDPQDIQNVFLPQMQSSYLKARPDIAGFKQLGVQMPEISAQTALRAIDKPSPEGVLGIIELAAKQNKPVPVSLLETARKTAVQGGSALDPATAMPFQVLKQGYDTAEQLLPNPSVLQQTARAARSAQGQIFENPQEIARIVGAGVPEAQFTPPTGEQILQTIVGAGAKGKAGAGKVVDDVLAAAGPEAPLVRADLRQAVIARAYTTAGESPAQLAKELNKIVTQNESLAKRLFTADELKLIGKGAEGSSVQRFTETFARPATFTGGGALGLLGSGLTAAGVAPAVGGPLAFLGGAAALGTAAARQSARDSAALSMGGLLRELGVQSQAPAMFSRVASPAAAGVATIPAQGAFTRQRQPVRIDISPTRMR